MVTSMVNPAMVVNIVWSIFLISSCYGYHTEPACIESNECNYKIAYKKFVDREVERDVESKFISVYNSFQHKDPIVNTRSGRISGTILQSIQEPHFSYYGFRGIPFAKPPLGKLRFKEPQAPTSWKPNVKKCQEYGSQCLQLSNIFTGSVVGSEDCLTINVFTKELRPRKPKPVMVFIYGGAWIIGSGDLYHADYLLEEDVVLVTFNYRLGIFGFLSTLDKSAYGNWGYKDQVFALEWVRDNIANFGGDPTSVTIFGQSAGAASVNVLQVVPRTKGLFHRVIAESGSAIMPIGLQRDPLKYVHNLGRSLNISLQSSRSIVDGLRQIDAATLLLTANNPAATGQMFNLHALPFLPVVEPRNDQAILTSGPYTYFSTGNFHKVPFIFGYNTGEGSVGLILAQPIIGQFDVDPTLFYTESFNNPGRAAEIGGRIRQFFLGNDSAAINIDGFLRFLGQELISRPQRKVLDFLDRSQGYYYHFSYKGTYTIPFPGVGHSEELEYIFPMAGTTTNLTANDVLTRKRMVKMWTNFAETGSPIPANEGGVLRNISWKKVNARGKDTVNYLDIGIDPEQKKNPDQDIYEFYKEMFRLYGRPPLQTY